MKHELALSLFDYQTPSGYVTKIYPDMRLVMSEVAEPAGARLYEILQAVFAGDSMSDVLRPVRAGRGTVYYCRLTDLGEVVIRVYRHGGIFGKVLGCRFLSPKRFLGELSITDKARKAGVTALKPIGIAYRKTLCGVRGVWVSRSIQGAVSLHEWMRLNPPSPRAVGSVAEAIAAMHRHGILHADLTIQNILMVRAVDSLPSVSIIDFDKAMVKPFLTARECMRQLRRLDRSLLKWLPEGSPWLRSWARLRFAVAYCRRNPSVRPFVKAYALRFRKFERKYRWGWGLQRLLGQPKRRR